MKYFFEAGVGSIPAFSMAETAVKASGTGARRPVDVCFARTGVERRHSSPMPQAAFYGDWGRTRSGGPRFCADLGFARTRTEWRLPQRAENRFRVTKALLAEE